MQNLRTPKVLLDRWLGGPSPAGQAAQNITSAPLQEIVWSARSHDDHDDDHNLLIVTRIISLRMTSRPNHPDNLQPSWRSKIAWRWIFWPKKADFSGFFLYIYIFLYSLYSFWQPLLLGLHKLLFKKIIYISWSMWTWPSPSASWGTCEEVPAALLSKLPQ